MDAGRRIHCADRSLSGFNIRTIPSWGTISRPSVCITAITRLTSTNICTGLSYVFRSPKTVLKSPLITSSQSVDLSEVGAGP